MTIGKKSCHDPVAGAIVDQGGDGDVDFLEMLAAEPRRPRAARAPAKAAKPAKVSKPKPKPDRPAEPAAADDNPTMSANRAKVKKGWKRWKPTWSICIMNLRMEIAKNKEASDSP